MLSRLINLTLISIYTREYLEWTAGHPKREEDVQEASKGKSAGGGGAKIEKYK